jgi:hypothetical protein
MTIRSARFARKTDGKHNLHSTGTLAIAVHQLNGVTRDDGLVPFGGTPGVLRAGGRCRYSETVLPGRGCPEAATRARRQSTWEALSEVGVKKGRSGQHGS